MLADETHQYLFVEFEVCKRIKSSVLDCVGINLNIIGLLQKEITIMTRLAKKKSKRA